MIVAKCLFYRDVDTGAGLCGVTQVLITVCFSTVSEPTSGVPNYLRSMYEYVKTLHTLRAEIAGVRKGNAMMPTFQDYRIICTLYSIYY